MAKRVQFINREDDLKTAQALIEEEGTQRVLCIEAQGGIGKTRLLQEIHDRAIDGFQHRLAPRPITVAIVQEFTNSAWSQQFLEGARDMAAELEINLTETDAAFDVDEMARDLERVIEQGADAIVIRLGSHEALRPGIQRAIEEGIHVLTFDNYLPQLKGLETRVNLDYTQGGLDLAEMLAAQLDYQGQVAAVSVSEEAIQTRRRSIFDNVLEKYPDITVVSDTYGHRGKGMAEVVAKQTREIVRRHPDLQAIWVTWDEYVRGVVETLIDLERTDIAVYAFDLCPADVPLMIQSDSPWLATVATNAADVGRIVVLLATQAAYERDLKSQYRIPMTLITRSELTEAIGDQSPGAVDFEALPFWKGSEMGWVSDIEPFQEKGLEQELWSLRVTDLIDFDDRSLTVSQNLWMHLADALGRPAFSSYRQRLLAFRQETSIAGHALSAQELERVHQEFIDCFNAISADKRIVTFFDTTDSLDKSKEVWREIQQIVPELRNCVFFIAGRNAGEIASALRSSMGNAVQTRHLPRLGYEASEDYLRRKQNLLRIELEKDVAERLLFLAAGRPVLIDLAVGWQAQTTPLDWLKGIDVEALERLSEEEREKERSELQDEFEKQLVQHVADTRRPLDWLVLTLAHIYPLDVPFATYLLSLTEEQVEVLWEQAKDYVFVKTLPDHRISLHDEMRRMVNAYAWPEVDLEGNRRRRQARRAARYLQQQLDELKSQIDRLRHTPAALIDERQLDDLERRYWTTKVEQVRYTLAADWREGIEAFAAAFDRAPLDIRSSLLEVVGRRVEEAKRNQEYDRETRYEYEIRLVKQKLRRLELKESRQIMEALRADYEEPQYQLDILTRLANYNMQSGRLFDAVECLREALDICETDPEMSKWTGRILDTLGMVTRRLGRLEDAATYHQKALEAYQETPSLDQAHLAEIFNNICYIKARQGLYESALNHCQEALKIREELGVDQAIAATHSTLGELYRNWGRYNTALEHYNEALRVFEPQNDRTWLARLYSQRGAVHRLIGDLEQAEGDLRRSIEFNVRTEMPWEYHVLGCVLWNKGSLDEALRHFDSSMRLAEQVHDIRTQVNNLVGTAEVSYAKWKASGQRDEVWRDTILEQAERLDEMSEQGYDFPHHYGRMQRVLGDLAFDEERYEDAREIYAEAYALLSKRQGGYGRRTFSDELDMLAKRIVLLAERDPRQAIAWCEYFYEHWSSEDLVIMRRETMLSMCSIHKAKALLRIKGQGSAP